MPIITMPDGANVQFPDDMPADQIKSMIAQKFPQEVGGLQSAAAPTVAPADGDIVRSTLFPVSRNRKTGEYSFDSDAGLLGAIKKAINLPSDVLSGKFVTAPEQPGVLTEIDVARERANQEALIGRTLDLAMLASPMSAGSRTAVSAAAAGVKGAKPALPEIETIKQAAHSAYKVADDAGIVVSPQSVRPVFDDIARTAITDGLDPTLHPAAWATLKRLGELKNEPLALSSIDTIRQIAKDAAASRTPGESRIASRMIDKIDDFVRGISEKDVVVSATNPEIGTKALFEARALWQAARKSEAVEGLVERAADRAGQFSGSGFENALRTEFRQFVMNKKNLRGYADDEIAALKKVARGGAIDNAARALGKFAPTGVVSSVLSGGTGAAFGGPAGAVALPAAGFLARQYATKRTMNNVDAVRSLVRGAQERELPGAMAGSRDILEELLARSAMFGPGATLLPRPAR